MNLGASGLSSVVKWAKCLRPAQLLRKLRQDGHKFKASLINLRVPTTDKKDKASILSK